MAGMMHPHEGTRGRYNTGCRCENCREANRIYKTEWNHRTGRSDPSKLCLPTHGAARYRKGCRCDLCRAANAANQRRARASKRARVQSGRGQSDG